MSVTYSNQIENHRGVYFEAVGDGVITALTVSHRRSVFGNTTAKATVTTAPSGANERKSGTGGFTYPATGTAVTVSSVTVSSTSITVHTSAAVANATKAYVAVVFDQSSVVG